MEMDFIPTFDHQQDEVDPNLMAFSPSFSITGNTRDFFLPQDQPAMDVEFGPQTPLLGSSPTLQLKVRTRLKAPPRSDWNRHRQLLRNLYIDQEYELKDVQQKMLLDHDFHASLQMYKKRFARWPEFPKYYKHDQKEEVATRLALSMYRPTSPIIVNGKPLQSHKIARHIRERRRQHQARSSMQGVIVPPLSRASGAQIIGIGKRQTLEIPDPGNTSTSDAAEDACSQQISDTSTCRGFQSYVSRGDMAKQSTARVQGISPLPRLGRRQKSQTHPNRRVPGIAGVSDPFQRHFLLVSPRVDASEQLLWHTQVYIQGVLAQVEVECALKFTDDWKDFSSWMACAVDELQNLKESVPNRYAITMLNKACACVKSAMDGSPVFFAQSLISHGAQDWGAFNELKTTVLRFVESMSDTYLEPTHHYAKIISLLPQAISEGIVYPFLEVWGESVDEWFTLSGNSEDFVLQTRWTRAREYKFIGEFEKARSLLQGIVEHLEPSDSLYSVCIFEQADICWQEDELDAAEATCLQVLKPIQEFGGGSQRWSSHAQWLMGNILWAKDKREESERYFRAALSTFLELSGRTDSSTWRTLWELEKMLEAFDQMEKLEQLYQEYADIFEMMQRGVVEDEDV